MPNATVARRYAQTFFELAKEGNILDKVYKDMRYLQEASELADVQSFLRNPVIGPTRKREIFKALFESKIDALSLNAMKAVFAHKRENLLGEICLSFKALYHTEAGISTAVLSSAVELSARAEQGILQEFQKTGVLRKTIELETVVDPSLIGGFVLEAEGQVYDASLRSKLAKMKKRFTENLYIKNL